MLKLTLNHAGVNCRVELDGVEISRFLTGVTVTADCGDVTRATLNYSGAVVVEGDAGVLTLQQAEHLIRCDECAKVLRGEEQRMRVVEVSNIGAGAREYTAVTQ